MLKIFQGLAFGRAFIIGLVIGATYYSAYYDGGSKLEQQISAVNDEILQSKNEIESVKKAIADAERYEKTMSNREVEMQKVLQAIPEKLDANDMMRTISVEAKGVGVEINGLVSRPSTRSQQNDSGKSFYEEVPIDIDLTGTYGQIMLFLSNMTRMDKIITASKMTFAVSAKGGQPQSVSVVPNINLKATLVAYRYSHEITKDETGGGRGNKKDGDND
ncbi:MAG: hypothetical protein A2Z20_09865 [Bdellovibrionales bacterium RBG_16_40_8]|nr:MAG: hypothetical protein A2Z20_09865 [Bdellovibrionales bacterium RBG_16_40_8]